MFPLRFRGGGEWRLCDSGGWGKAFELGGAPGWPQTGFVARPVHRDIKTGRSASLKTVRVTPPNIHSLT